MRHLAGVAAAALMFAIAAPAFAQPFADVPTNHWAYDAIAELAAKGLIEGYPDGTYKGDRAMTRYEMAMVVARLLARIESIQIPTPPPPPRPEVTRADIQAIQRLVNEFRAELAALGVRVTAIEEELNAIKAKLDNVRITGYYRFRYNDQRSASGPSVNSCGPGCAGNPNAKSVDASMNPSLPDAIQGLQLAFDGSVAPDVHLIVALLTNGGGGGKPVTGYNDFASQNFGLGGSQNNIIGTVDNLFFDWRNAFGWPLEFWLGRFGGGVKPGAPGKHYPVQFGPFGLLLNTNDKAWRDSTADSGSNVVDGLRAAGRVRGLADLQWQALIARVVGGIGSTSYAWGEDAYGFDANVRILPGLRLGGYYVGNSITNPAGFPAGTFPAGAALGPTWHLYGPGGTTTNPPTVPVGSTGAGCQPGPQPGAVTGFVCPALGSGGGGYVLWDVTPGIHLDGEFAQWNDAVHSTSDTGYQVNVSWDLGKLTGIGHNLHIDTGYLNYGVNFYPPYSGATADSAMTGSIYMNNTNGFIGDISFDPIRNWTLYGIFFSGSNISNGQNLTEYEAGVRYAFARSARITFLVRDQRINNVEQFLLYRAQVDYSF